MADKKHLEELARFIREHRSDEANFERLYHKLEETYTTLQKSDTQPKDNGFAENLHKILETQAATYKQNKEKGISTWSEFETFVTHFEKAVIEALHQP